MNQSVTMTSVESNDTSGAPAESGKSWLIAVALPVVMLLETVLILSWILNKADHGFDLSDESFYMTCVEMPREYPISVSEFGSVLSIPFMCVGGDLIAFRQLNILATFGLSIVVAYQLLGTWLQSFGCTLFIRLAISATFALPSLTLMSYWLLTPSYNSLNGVAFLLVCIAVFSNAKTERRQLSAAVLIGLGGYLSFMAKPTSAAALGIMVLVFVWGVERWSWKSLVVAVGSALIFLVVTMCLLAGDPIAYIGELRETMAISKDPTHSFRKLIQWNSPHLDTRWRIIFGVACLFLFALLRFGTRKWRDGVNVWPVRLVSFLLLGLGAFGVAATWFDFQNVSVAFLEHRDDEYGRKERYLFLSTLSLVVLAVYFREMDRRRMAAACFLFWLPYAFAFGTNINYWDKGATLAFFWIISFAVAITALPPRRQQVNAVVLIATCLPLFCILDLQNAYTNPYRQQSFTEGAMKPVKIGLGEAEVLMAQETADLIQVLRSSVIDAGFSEGTPVLDLSGQGIGLIYTIGGRNFPAAWSASGAPWAQEALRQGLVRRRDEGVEDLWILKKENWEHSNSDTVLEEVGLSMADFVEVIRIPTTAVVGNRAPRLLTADQTDVRLVLYKRSSQVKAPEVGPESAN